MILEVIIFAIFVSIIFNLILDKFKMPTIIGYILTWTIISYVFWLHDVATNNHDLKTIAEFGIVFLMFTIWLEFSIENLVKMKKNVFFYWTLQFFISSIVFYCILNFLFWFDVKQSIIISVWLSLSSTAIVLKLLNESWDINKLYWNKSLWILLFQDLMVVPILLLITFLSSTDVSVWYLLWKTMISWVLLFIILVILWRYLLDYFFEKISQTKSNEIFIAFVLFIVLSSSSLAHLLWFSYSLWALIAWVLIAETHYKHQVEADLIPFRDLLLGLFFVTVWMQLKLEVVFDNLYFILLLLFVFLTLKVLILYAIVFFRKSKQVALRTALALFQFWEFGIVIFEIASINNIISHSYTQIFIVVIIISMILTPFVFKNIDKIVRFILKKSKYECWEIITEKLEDHVILIWYWRLWDIISWFLEERKQKYVILENFIKAFKKAELAWKPIIYWSAEESNNLKSLKISKAKAVLISVWKSKQLFSIVDTIKKTDFSWKLIVKVNNYEEKEILEKMWVKYILVETEKTALEMIENI